MWLLPLETHSGVREAPRGGWAEPWPWALDLMQLLSIAMGSFLGKHGG